METADVKRVCAYFSSGPHYRRVLMRLRAQYPGATLCAFVPPRYPREVAAEFADEVEVADRDRYGLRDVVAFVRLVRRIRAARFDVFIVMFDSPRLAVLARLSGASIRRCHTLEGRELPLRLTLLGQAFVVFWRRLRGRWTCARIRHGLRRPVGEE